MQNRKKMQTSAEDDSTRSLAANGTYRVRLHISYDGTKYEGWQRQSPPVPTVQAAVEDALSKMLSEKINVFGASRTDSGVHAIQQVLHFDCPKDPTTFKDLPYRLQSLLPVDIVAKEAYLAPPNFDSSWNAESKTYKYVIWNQLRPNPIRKFYNLWVRRPLDLELLNRYSKIIEGTMLADAVITMASMNFIAGEFDR
jgi:tRNA pseudouridine38-40 synthase